MLKRTLALSLAVLCILSYTMGFATSSENDNLWTTLKGYLSKVIDYEQYFNFTMGSSGFEPYVVYFAFDFRQGNQSVSININDKCFTVSTYQEGDMPPLIALYKLLPMFPEIAAELPQSYTLRFVVRFGEVHGETHTVEITPTTYKLFMEGAK